MASKLFRFLRAGWNRFWRLFHREALYKAVDVMDLPDVLSSSTIYLIGENGNLWQIAMLCPCGCGEVIQLNALEQSHPQWKAIRSKNISLHPSINRVVGCKSHFWVRRGRIDWV